jgi:hypothetical protein
MRFKNKYKRLKHRKVNERKRERESSIKKRGLKEYRMDGIGKKSVKV